MSVTFTGTAVQWIGPKNTNGGVADVSIDGTQVAIVDTYSPGGKQFQQVLFSTSGLSSGTHTLTITVTGQKDTASSADTVVIDAINVPTAAQLAGYYPQVPQSGTITLDGRDSRLLAANYDFGGQHLVYSTSELMTQAAIAGNDTALLYDPQGTDGETVLQYASQPTVSVLSGTVQATWDASRGDLRLGYTHNGLAEVRITGGGTGPLLLIADTNTAEDFWPETTGAGPARTVRCAGPSPGPHRSPCQRSPAGGSHPRHRRPSRASTTARGRWPTTRSPTTARCPRRCCTPRTTASSGTAGTSARPERRRVSR